jgi:predicted transglutaminase-like cysteine proteinase
VESSEKYVKMLAGIQHSDILWMFFIFLTVFSMKKSLLSLGLISTLVVLASIASAATPAPCTPTGTGTVQNAQKCELQKRQSALKEATKSRQTENKELRKSVSGEVREFRLENSGAIREAVKSLTGSNLESLRQVKSSGALLHKTMSGKTLEQKLSMSGAIEDQARAQIVAKFKNNPTLLIARLAVYDTNKAKRDQIRMNQLQTLMDRGGIRLMEVQEFARYVTAKTPSLTPAQKTELVKKIDAKLTSLQSAKNIPSADQKTMVEVLTTLKVALQK